MEFKLTYLNINKSNYFMPAYLIEPDCPKGGILLLHGFQSSKDYILGLGMRIARRGFAVLMPDQRGAGENKNKLDINFLEDIHLSLEYLKKFSRIGIVGYSLNGFTALYSSAEAIVAISPPDESIVTAKALEYDIQGVSAEQLSHLLSQFTFNSESPKLIIYGENEEEEYIQAAAKLKSIISNCELIEIQGAYHNNICYKEEVLKLVPEWIEQKLST